MPLEVFNIIRRFIDEPKAAPFFISEDTKEWQDAKGCRSIFDIEKVRKCHSVVFSFLVNLTVRLDIVIIRNFDNFVCIRLPLLKSTKVR